MDTILGFIGDVIGRMYGLIPSYGACVALLALADKLLFAFVGKRYYGSLRTYKDLAPQVEKLGAKYADNPSKRAQALTKLLAENHFPVLGGLGNLVAEALFSFLLIGVFRNPQAYLEHLPATGAPLFGPLTLSDSPLALLNAGAPMALRTAILFAMLTLCAVIWHDQYMDRASFIGQSYTRVVWVLLGLSFFCFNQAYTLYWLAIKLMDFAYILFVTKLKPGTVK